MGAEPGNHDGAAGTVEARIVDKRELGREIEAAKYVSRVVSLARAFAPVAEGAVP